MARRAGNDIERWTAIIIFSIIIIALIWALVPHWIIYLSIIFIIVLVIIIFYVVYRRHGFQGLKKLTEKVYGFFRDILKEKRKTQVVRPLTEKEKYPLYRRAGDRCENPNCKSPYRHLDVHHIQPRAESGSNKYDNLIVLCKACHADAQGGAYTKAQLRRWISDRKREIGYYR